MQNNIRALHKSLRILKYIKKIKMSRQRTWLGEGIVLHMLTRKEQILSLYTPQWLPLKFQNYKREDWGIYMIQNSYHLLKGIFLCFIFPLPPWVLYIRKRSTYLFPLQKAQHACIQEQLQRHSLLRRNIAVSLGWGVLTTISSGKVLKPDGIPSSFRI